MNSKENGRIMAEKRFALISVSRKKGIETLARGLVDLGFTILSTGGTADAITGAGLPVTRVADYTGAPEILAGNIKTLHPKIHSGILAGLSKEDAAEMGKVNGSLIELVIVNLNPIERLISDPQGTLDEVMSMIDPGGPALLRSAAKNFERVTTVCDPDDYETILWHLAQNDKIPLDIRVQMAIKAFTHTAEYDVAVVETISEFDLTTGKRSN